MPFYPFFTLFHDYEMLNDVNNMVKSSNSTSQNFLKKRSPLERHFVRSSGLHNFPKLLGGLFSRSSENTSARADRANIRNSGLFSSFDLSFLQKHFNIDENPSPKTLGTHLTSTFKLLNKPKCIMHKSNP